MKKIVLLIAIVFVTVSSAYATPIYQGDPVSDLGAGVQPETWSQGAGYYIWANDAARTSWSVRWTGAGTWWDWSGLVQYTNDINEVVEFRWEDHDGDLNLYNGAIEFITFDAYAGTAWDGFDFTLTGDVGDYLTFTLYSEGWELGLLEQGVYIGQDFEYVLDNVDSAALFASADGSQRQFEVAAPVPEPSTFLLLGGGLIGLAYYRRRK